MQVCAGEQTDQYIKNWVTKELTWAQIGPYCQLVFLQEFKFDHINDEKGTQQVMVPEKV